MSNPKEGKIKPPGGLAEPDEGTGSFSDQTTQQPSRASDASTKVNDSPPTLLPEPRPKPGSSGLTFSPGERVASRYAILRFLGQGGMGEVYEAEDIELDERVALKTIRPEITGSDDSIQRFKREIQLARKVTHPNVCRIFDFGYHQPAESHNGVTFLTMELLHGETLAERLQRTGLLNASGALPLVKQMGAGLGAAHQAGVVHRDFKSANVMLIASPSSEGGIRAVVTDFGLARRAAADADSTLAAPTAGIVGTPAYMAPEQVEGAKISPATDIYSLGAVIYEMVTGKLPFHGDTPLATAVKRLKEPPIPPRSYAPDLDPKWEATILRCLARRPEDRFASVEEVARSLAGEAVARPGRARRARWAVAAGSFLIILVAWAGYRLVHRVAPRASTAAADGPSLELPPTPTHLRRSVAVVGFKNLSGQPDAAPFSTELTEGFNNELEEGGALHVISGEDVARMKLSLSLPDVDSYARETLTQIGSYLGANLVVVGSYWVIGSPNQAQIRLDLTLQDTRRGITVNSVSETGNVSKLLDLISKAGTKLRKDIGIGEVSATEAAQVRAATPSNHVAATYYSEGLDRLHLYDALAAKALLQKAVAADPKFPLTHAALARAWSDLGYDAQAEQEAKTAIDLSQGLAQKDRLLIEARFYELGHQLPQAAETYRALWQFFPDNLEYGLSLASVLWKSGKASQALQVTAALEKLPAPEGGDPRIEIARSAALGALGNFKGELESAAVAARKAAALGARIELAIAETRQCMAEDDLSESKEAIADCEQAKEIFTALGDRYNVGNTLLDLANAEDHLGNAAQAKSMFEQALEVFQGIGYENGVAICLNNIAVVLTDQGNWNDAKSKAEESLALTQRIGRKDTGLAALNTLAGVYYNQGDYSNAAETEQHYLAMAREIGDKAGAARALGNLGLILSYQAGKSDQSVKMYQQALAAWREIGTKGEIAAMLGNIANELYEQGKVREAKTNYEHATAMARSIGDRSGEALYLQNEANALYDEGDLKSSLNMYQQSLALSRSMGYKMDALRTLNALGDVYLDEGDFDMAKKNYQEAGTIALAQKNLGDTIMNRVNLDSVMLAEGKAAEAAAGARGAAAEYHKYHAAKQEAVTRTLLARAELAQGKFADALRAANQVLQLAPQSSDIHVTLPASIVQAQALAAVGRTADAEKLATTALDKTKQMGLVPYQIQAEIALGEIEIKSGKMARGRAHLDAACNDAQSRGFTLLASQAAKAVAPRHRP